MTPWLISIDCSSEHGVCIGQNSKLKPFALLRYGIFKIHHAALLLEIIRPLIPTMDFWLFLTDFDALKCYIAVIAELGNYLSQNIICFNIPKLKFEYLFHAAYNHNVLPATQL